MGQASVSLGYNEDQVMPGLLITLSSQHAAKQAAASATQTIAAAQHAASAPKASAGPQPLLVQSCKVSLQEACGSGEAGQEGLQNMTHDISTFRLWQSRFHCWCRVSEEAKLNLTALVLSSLSLLPARASCRQDIPLLRPDPPMSP